MASTENKVFYARKSNKPVATAVISYIAAILYIVIVALVIMCFIAVKNGNKGMMIGTADGTLGVVAGLFLISKVFVWEIEPKIEKKTDCYKYSYRTPVGAGAGKAECSVYIFSIDKIKRQGYKTIIYGDLDVSDGIRNKKATQSVIYGVFDDDVYDVLKTANYRRKENTEYDNYSESVVEAAEQAVKNKKSTSKF